MDEITRRIYVCCMSLIRHSPRLLHWFGFIKVFSFPPLPFITRETYSSFPSPFFPPSSSLSAQTSFSVGAVLNATFGSIIELILYFSALFGGLSDVVQASVTGSCFPVSHPFPKEALTRFVKPRFIISAYAFVARIIYVVRRY